MQCLVMPVLFYRYQLMQDCWKVVPNERPTFDDIVTRLARVIEYHCTSPEVR